MASTQIITYLRDLSWFIHFIVTLLKFITALVRPLLMHALENFEDLSV